MTAMGTNITFLGCCDEALSFYKNIFNGVVEKKVTFGEMKNMLGGEGIVAGKEHYIFNARLSIKMGENKSYLYLNDSPSILFSNVKGGNQDNLTIVLEVKSKELVQEYFGKLVEGGKTNIEPRENDAKEFEGSLIDKYGVCWIIKCEKDVL